MAKYRCRECQTLEAVPRPHKFHFGARVRCHRCGSFRVTKLRVRDKIDPMEPGLLNLLEKLAGGNLYHCKFCRIQFWDRRRFVPQVVTTPPPAPSTRGTEEAKRTEPKPPAQAAAAKSPAAPEVDEEGE